MDDTRTETVPLIDGSALRLTVAEPVGPPRGGIVVLHEARGMTDAVRSMVVGLAAAGWLPVAPPLYHRADAAEIGEDAGARLRAPTEYGGYCGYFADPDGHAWEVVRAPGFDFTDDGRLILPD